MFHRNKSHLVSSAEYSCNIFCVQQGITFLKVVAPSHHSNFIHYSLKISLYLQNMKKKIVPFSVLKINSPIELAMLSDENESGVFSNLFNIISSNCRYCCCNCTTWANKPFMLNNFFFHFIPTPNFKCPIKASNMPLPLLYFVTSWYR